MTTKARSSVLDDGPPLSKNTPSSKGKKRWQGVSTKERSAAMSKVVHQRWKGVTQTEDDIRAYFNAADLDEVLETFAIMRKHYEVAGKVLDERVQKERNKEACANCGKEFTKDIPWFNRNPVKDPDTGIITNIFTCSQACLIATKSNQPRRRPF